MSDLSDPQTVPLELLANICLLEGDSSFGNALIVGPVAGTLEAEVHRVSTLVHAPYGLIVEQEERAEAAPLRAQNAGDLRDVVVSSVRKQMGEDRCQHGEVERSILEREPVLASREAPHRVVVPVVEIGHLKTEVRIVRRDGLLTPLDSARDDVDSFVPALQPIGEPNGGSAHTATDIEDVLTRTKISQIHEEFPKLVSGGTKVAAPDKCEAARRRQRIARAAKGCIAGVKSRRAHERRWAHQADVLKFSTQSPHSGFDGCGNSMRAILAMSETSDVQEARVHVGRHRYAISSPDGDWIGGTAQRTGRPYEHDLLRVLGPFARRSSIVVDVGANIGNHTLYFAIVRRVTVHAFEPNPVAVRYLRANVEANDARKVHVHEVGLSDEPGRGRIAPAEELGMASVEQDDSGEIDLRLLDSYDFSPDPRIAVIKIDVEGAEARVLKGAEATIRAHRPIIALEALGEEARPMLSALGYRRFPVRFCWTPTYVFYPRLAQVPALALLAFRAKVPIWWENWRTRLRLRYRRLTADRDVIQPR
jgi:FkbM family methyltransferase